MEVFIAFTKDSLFSDLTDTLLVWEKIPFAEPIAIEVPKVKYEIIRRVTAENMSIGNYLLCDLGCVPNEEDCISLVEGLFLEDEKVGMIRFLPESGIRACRKGVVEKWPKRESINYQHEHEMAYLLEGYLVPKCSLSYRRLGVH